MSINTTGYWALVMRALKETGGVASVYTQMENPDNFYIGYIMHMSARHFTMRVMDIDGSHDGWLTGRCARCQAGNRGRRLRGAHEVAGDAAGHARTRGPA